MSRAGILLAGLLALTGPAEGADFWVAAFGDSITEGCCDEPRNGGYPERLAELWGCVYFPAPFPPPPGTPVPCPAADPYPACAVVNPPGTCALANRGLSGETATFTQYGDGTIVEGLSRLQSEVLPEWPWDVLVLMEGTNDILLRRSIPTIRAALEAMDEAAADRGVDIVHAPIVEFHPYAYSFTSACPPNSPIRPWLPADQALLRSAVIDIAETRNRYLSDQANRVCPDSGLDSHGHTRSECQFYDYGEKCIVGHPSGSRNNMSLPDAWQYEGYGNMAEGFLATLTSAPIPGTVVPTAPAGDLCGAPPSFDWMKESSEAATWYRVEIDGGAYGKWHQETDWRPAEPDLCKPDSDADDACSLASPLALAPGIHSWRVRGRNPGGLGAWSPATAFRIFLAAPAATSPVYPATPVFDSTPTYRWLRLLDAAAYELEVWNGASWIAAGTFADATCGPSICAAQPAAPVFAAGDYRFRVRARNACAAGPLSAEQPFTVLDCAAYPDVDLENGSVAGVETHRACSRIRAGNLGAGGYVVDDAADSLSLHAGSVIEIHNGFAVLAGSFAASVDY